jgi:capsid protein
MRLGRFHFGYNATEDKSRRQAPKTRVYHEGEILTKYSRLKLQATAQEQVRNHSLVAWMVRKHLDYVSKFHVSFRTGNKQLDALVNRIFRWHGAPRNLDYGRRFGRDELFRLFELEKVVCGDAALLKLPALKLQAIESDLIAKGDGAPEGVNDSGLVMDNGRVLQYAICNRGANGATPTHDHLEPADNVIFDAYWTRFSSQFRGVSPLSTAINMVQDIHEGLEYNLVKAKMHALFGIALTRDSDGSSELGGASGATAETASATATATDTHLDINPRAVNILDLKPGDDAKILESGTPSTEFVEGSFLFIQIAMLALDIPVTAFDSRRSSFSARIADLNEYEVSCDSKRTKNRYVRQEYSDWVLATIWNTPDSPWKLGDIADRAGMTLRDVQESVEWIPAGSPWLDKYRQIQGDQLGIDIVLDNAIDACRRRGVDVFDNIDKQAEVIAYAKLKGVPILSGSSGQRTVEEAVTSGADKEGAGVQDE